MQSEKIKTMDELKPNLEECNFKFSQEGNCNSRSGEYEFLDITFESDIGIDRTDGGYFVIKTEKWSVDGASDLEAIFDRIRNLLNKKQDNG